MATALVFLVSLLLVAANLLAYLEAFDRMNPYGQVITVRRTLEGTWTTANGQTKQARVKLTEWKYRQ